MVPRRAGALHAAAERQGARRTRQGCPRGGAVATAEPSAPDASCPGRRRPGGRRARGACPPHVQAPGVARHAQARRTARRGDPAAAGCGKGGRHGRRSSLRQGRSLRRPERHVPRAREAGGPRRARGDASGARARPRAGPDPAGQGTSTRPREGGRPPLRHDRERHRAPRALRHQGRPGGGGGPPAGPPRGRWGPRRKPRAPPFQRASHLAPRGRAISAFERGRAHRQQGDRRAALRRGDPRWRRPTSPSPRGRPPPCASRTPRASVPPFRQPAPRHTSGTRSPSRLRQHLRHSPVVYGLCAFRHSWDGGRPTQGDGPGPHHGSAERSPSSTRPVRRLA